MGIPVNPSMKSVQILGTLLSIDCVVLTESSFRLCANCSTFRGVREWVVLQKLPKNTRAPLGLIVPDFLLVLCGHLISPSSRSEIHSITKKSKLKEPPNGGSTQPYVH
jgi:hypothetical protein